MSERSLIEMVHESRQACTRDVLLIYRPATAIYLGHKYAFAGVAIGIKGTGGGRNLNILELSVTRHCEALILTIGPHFPPESFAGLQHSGLNFLQR